MSAKPTTPDSPDAGHTESAEHSEVDVENSAQLMDDGASDDQTQSPDHQRRLAVQMRLDGQTIEQTREKTGLSAPTIIAAHKAYLSGGWPAVTSRPRGRRHGTTALSEDLQSSLKRQLISTAPESLDNSQSLWSYSLGKRWLESVGHKFSLRSATRYLQAWGFDGQHPVHRASNKSNTQFQSWLSGPHQEILESLKLQAITSYWIGLSTYSGQTVYFGYSSRKQFFWSVDYQAPSAKQSIDFIKRLCKLTKNPCHLFVADIDINHVPVLKQWLEEQPHVSYTQVPVVQAMQEPEQQRSKPRNKQIETEITSMTQSSENNTPGGQLHVASGQSLTHLQQLEAESIAIIREVVAESENPAMLYSLGKDSAVMLDLAIKAFYPALPPFPLLHIDTTWKFRAMYEHRDQLAKHSGLEMLIHTNPEGLAQGVNPFSHGSALHTEIMKTEALKQALNKYRFDTALVGSRRDEEKSRAKERIFSFRNTQHRWDPKNQRPELWKLYNTRKSPGESFRAYPLSNWTEFDIWHYIHRENLPVIPLYFATDRPVVDRDGALIVVDDDRMPLHDGEIPVIKRVRFRSVGCYPLTGGFESSATSSEEVLRELWTSTNSERMGRMIDHDSTTSLEKKKLDGYF